MLWKYYTSRCICNSLFNSALPDSRLRCHVAYSNNSWLKISKLRQVDRFAGGYVRTVDVSIIIIITTLSLPPLLFIALGALQQLFLVRDAAVCNSKAASSRQHLRQPRGAAVWGKGTEMAADLFSLLLLKQLLFLAGFWWEEVCCSRRGSFFLENTCVSACWAAQRVTDGRAV